VSISLLIAQEMPAPDWAKGPILAAVLGFAAGLIPHVISLYKTWGQERRLDEELSTSDRRQLLKDLRTEREEIRLEMRKLRLEHDECLKKSAAQEADLKWMKVEIAELHAEMTDVQTEITSVVEQSRTVDRENPRK
jgi:uncharacterized protein (DUF3084 family)